MASSSSWTTLDDINIKTICDNYVERVCHLPHIQTYHVYFIKQTSASCKKSPRLLWWLQSRINDTNNHQKNMKIRTRISSDQLNINRRGQYRLILAERSCEHLLKFRAAKQEILSLFLLSTKNQSDSFSIITSVTILLPTLEECGPFLAPLGENKLQHDAQLTWLKVTTSLWARDVLRVRKSICIQERKEQHMITKMEVRNHQVIWRI